MNKVVSSRYHIVNQIGTGGMAIVYRAWDELKKREVAIKVLKPEYEANRDFVRRFNREAMAAAKMSHENIVRMFDVGIDGDMRYIVMEYIEGRTLKDLIQEQQRLPSQLAVRMSLRILAALDHAHKNSIIHRDIKPQNILVDKSDMIKVADFGIARLLDSSTGSITDTNTALGSVHYVSPEQASGGNVDEKSDLYSVGVVLYEMLTGTVPFDGETAVAVALKQVQEQPKSMRLLHRDISKGLDEVVMKALEKNPSRRYQTAAEMASDLKRALKMPGGGFVTFNENAEAHSDDINVFEKPAMGHARRRTPIIAAIAGLMILAIVVIGVTRISNILYGITIPNVKGYEESIAEMMLVNYELTSDVIYEYNNDVNTGLVVRQVPEAGTNGRKNDLVTMYVSKGVQPVKLPDTTGMTKDDALGLLSEYGFIEVKIEYDVDETLNENLVLKQSPNDGAAQPGTIIALTINSRKVAMPQLSGKTLAQATALLAQYDIKIKKVSNGYSMDAAANTIIAQTIPADTLVFKGITVDVTVSLAITETYYAEYQFLVPLTMQVRVTQTSPSGVETEVMNELVSANTTKNLKLNSTEGGEHEVKLYFDGELKRADKVTFE